jgi:hypothetical protein
LLQKINSTYLKIFITINLIYWIARNIKITRWIWRFTKIFQNWSRITIQVLNNRHYLKIIENFIVMIIATCNQILSAFSSFKVSSFLFVLLFSSKWGKLIITIKYPISLFEEKLSSFTSSPINRTTPTKWMFILQLRAHAWN